ncbi:MAG: beta(1,3)galactosyltransferase EpsH [Lachnospiraceae bacterium]|nr:beta(1,3)galactosyltransferase EpsH [Lachnospiraceae bacterium]
MIFVTLGSQKFQFDRLLKEIDSLIEKGVIKEEVFAQTGASTYTPVNFKYKNFLDREEFASYIDKCDTVITHGGTGVIIGAVKKKKKVIAIPRLSKFNEHVDDHQIELLRQFDELNIICACYELSELGEKYMQLGNMEFKEYVSNTQTIIDSIEEYLNTL